MQKLRITSLFFFAICLLTVNLAFAKVPNTATTSSSLSSSEAILLQDKEATYLAKVVQITHAEMKEVPNTNTKALYQNVVVQFLSGEKVGKEVTIEDSAFIMKVGDKIYVKYLATGDGSEYYSISEPYRIPSLLFLVVLFVVAVLFFGGKQGFLALIALFVSFGGIFTFLFPKMINGGNVVILSTVGALLCLFVVMYVTHGFNRMTTSAFLGCSFSVLVTVLLARYAVKLTALTGFSDDESVYLNIATGGHLNFVALLIGGIIIGVVGVIDDVAITQASVVSELKHANQNLSKKQLYTKALKVGKDHIGAVINTLILAYTGASLPLVLLLYTSTTPVLELINREAIATEIVRSIVGSVGLLCAVPLTTLIAVILINKETIHKVTHHH